MAGGNFSVNQPWMIVLALFFIIGAILFGVQAYFYSKEVHALRAGCFNQGGAARCGNDVFTSWRLFVRV